MEPLASVGELETHLQRDLDATGAQLALELASGAVRAYCGWDLSRQAQTFHVSTDGGVLITLPTLELHAVVEVRADATVVDPLKWPYSFTRGGQLWGSFAPKVQYEVDVVHGYDPIPDLVKLVTLDFAGRSMNNPMGLVSATTGQVSRTWSTGSSSSPMSTLHERLLDRYAL